MNKIYTKAIVTLLAIFCISIPLHAKGTYILCYHSFLDKKDIYSIRMDMFREQLNKLKKGGYRFITFDDYKSGNIHGDKNILITIDDGSRSVYEAYYSIMKPLGIKPVLGIYPALISRKDYALTWEQLKKLKAEGCYIAAHGYHHMFLSTKYYKKDPAGFKKEIYLSKKVLEEKLGIKIDTMIYPFGLTSDIAMTELRNAGYKYAMSLVQKISLSPPADPLNMPRYMITKPNQKGIISFLMSVSSKNISSAKSGDAVVADNSVKEKPDVAAEHKEKGKDKISITNYPMKLKQLVMNDIIFMPDNHPEGKKNSLKFKPFVDNTVASESGHRNLKNVSHEKKNSTEKEGIIEQKQNSKLLKIKNFYWSLMDNCRNYSLLFIDKTKSGVETVKIKIK